MSWRSPSGVRGDLFKGCRLDAISDARREKNFDFGGRAAYRPISRPHLYTDARLRK
jgi:hypothetical protein